MAYTTHEKIRVESGFQQRFMHEEFKNSPDGSNDTFYVQSDDLYKFVPNFNTGATVAGVSDVQVFVGVSGGLGLSRMDIDSIDSDLGYVKLSNVPTSGSSLVVSYASSPIASYEIEAVRLQAESIVNQRMSLCYDLPVSPVPSYITNLTTRLSSALLLIRGYGTGARDTSGDGYALWNQLMGNGEVSNENSTGILQVGEIGMICTPHYQLVDDNGVKIPRNDEDIEGNQGYVDGGRVSGRLYDITEEEFRFKDYQVDADKNQPGSLKNS